MLWNKTVNAVNERFKVKFPTPPSHSPAGASSPGLLPTAGIKIFIKTPMRIGCFKSRNPLGWFWSVIFPIEFQIGMKTKAIFQFV